MSWVYLVEFDCENCFITLGLHQDKTTTTQNRYRVLWNKNITSCATKCNISRPQHTTLREQLKHINHPTLQIFNTTETGADSLVKSLVRTNWFSLPVVWLLTLEELKKQWALLLYLLLWYRILYVYISNDNNVPIYLFD